jgi:hypothetical protein
MGYSRKAASIVLDVLKNLDVFDDISLFQISNLLTGWEFPRSQRALERIEALDAQIIKLGFALKEPSGFHAILWFKAKYSSQLELLEFLKKYQNLWQSNSFLRRQATACMARTFGVPGGAAAKILSQQALSGVPSTVSVATQLTQFSETLKIEQKVRLYLFPTTKQRIYPLGKFMVLCAFLNSEPVRTSTEVRTQVLERVSDPTYRHHLKRQYGIF